MDKKCTLVMVGGFTVLGFLWGAFMAGCVLSRRYDGKALCHTPQSTPPGNNPPA